MDKRILISALAFLLAVALGYVAPEESTALVYRMTVALFVALLFTSRVLSLGAFSGRGDFHYANVFARFDLPYR